MYSQVLLLLSYFIFSVITKESIRGLHSSSQFWWGDRTPLFPKFLSSPQNVSVFVGDSAFLPCNVEHLGDRTVTWMRQRDLHILTADSLTFSADVRFKVLHPENSHEWTLQIKSVTPADDGVYECQVNSDPKISKKVFLKIIEFSLLDDPETFKEKKDTRSWVEIEGPSVRHVQEGSVLSLTCVARHRGHPSFREFLWSKGAAPLAFDSPRGGISVQTDRRMTKAISQLRVSAITSADGGEYSCRVADFSPSSVTVHIEKGQKDAAVIHRKINGAKEKYLEVILLLFTFTLVLFSLTTCN